MLLVAGYRSPALLDLMSGALVVKSLTANPKRSNSMEILLSVVRRRMDTRFFIKPGETRMLLRLRLVVGVGNVVCPRPKVGMRSPLPTIMEVERLLEAGTEIIHGLCDMCAVAPLSIYQFGSASDTPVGVLMADGLCRDDDDDPAAKA